MAIPKESIMNVQLVKNELVESKREIADVVNPDKGEVIGISKKNEIDGAVRVDNNDALDGDPFAILSAHLIDVARRDKNIEVNLAGAEEVSNTGHKVSHVGIVVGDAEEVSEHLSSLFGITDWTTVDYLAIKEAMILGEPFRLKLKYAKFGPLTIELLEPVEGRSIWADFLRASGGGVHHLAFKVSDWDKSVSRVTSSGGKVLVGAGYGDSRWCYLETGRGKMIIEYMDNYEL